MDDLPLYARLARATSVAPRQKKRAAPTDVGAPAAASRKKAKGPGEKGTSSGQTSVVEVPALERQEAAAAVASSPAAGPEALVRREASTSEGGTEAEVRVEEPSTSVPDLPSSSSLPPPPPLPKPLLTRGRLWQDGVVPEVATAFLPPMHFTSCAALTQPALDELHRNQAELCRAIGYNQAFIMVRELYARLHADAQRLKAQVGELAQKLSAAEAKAASVGELREELEVAEAKARSAGEELAKAWTERDTAVSALEVVRVELAATQAERDVAKTAAVKAGSELQHAREGAEKLAEDCARAKKGAADAVAAARVLQQQRGSLMEKNAELQKALEAERDGRQEATDALVEAAEECFEQALAQIRYFNPGVELRVDGYDHRAYVKADGTLIPYSSPNAAEEGAADAPEGSDPVSNSPPASEDPAATGDQPSY